LPALHANSSPIIYSSGTSDSRAGTDRILLVNGNLELSGGVQFFGPVIVLGQ
jgi:hypothetical protein